MKKLKKVLVVGKGAFVPGGSILNLDENQAKRRRHLLYKISDGSFMAKSRLFFKSGEELEIETLRGSTGLEEKIKTPASTEAEEGGNDEESSEDEREESLPEDVPEEEEDSLPEAEEGGQEEKTAATVALPRKEKKSFKKR